MKPESCRTITEGANGAKLSECELSRLFNCGDGLFQRTDVCRSSIWQISSKSGSSLLSSPGSQTREYRHRRPERKRDAGKDP
ncbi:hypothetical protein Q8A67_025801 [Cirrhinus molitorella]|uniref:Uncharacterized protein n=1 Tax=Cirrhinus molitorella TaxID=172907 RepID=A0AA88P107_9TELE|nr:hypothetical protein Q8A67_025801 [Cirrhinus molitorella]